MLRATVSCFRFNQPVLVFLVYVAHILAVPGDGPDDPDVAEHYEDQLLHEAEPDDAVVEGDVLRGPRQVIEGATDPEALGDVLRPAHQRRSGPDDGPDPGYGDEQQGSFPRRYLPGFERTCDDEVAIERYRCQVVDRTEAGDRSRVGVELASCLKQNIFHICSATETHFSGIYFKSTSGLLSASCSASERLRTADSRILV